MAARNVGKRKVKNRGAGTFLFSNIIRDVISVTMITALR